MPRLGKALHFSFMNWVNWAKLLASTSVMTLDACCCTRRHSVVCPRRRRSCSGPGGDWAPGGSAERWRACCSHRDCDGSRSQTGRCSGIFQRGSWNVTPTPEHDRQGDRAVAPDPGRRHGDRQGWTGESATMKLPIPIVGSWPARGANQRQRPGNSACTDSDVEGHSRWLEIAQIRVCCKSRQSIFLGFEASEQTC